MLIGWKVLLEMFRLAVLKFARCFDSYVANLFFVSALRKILGIYWGGFYSDHIQ